MMRNYIITLYIFSVMHVTAFCMHVNQAQAETGIEQELDSYEVGDLGEDSAVYKAALKAFEELSLDDKAVVVTDVADDIKDYDPADEAALKEIAIQAMYALTTRVNLLTGEKGTEKAYQNEIKRAFDLAGVVSSQDMHEGMRSKVICDQESKRPIGFINYRFVKPWHRSFIFNEAGPNAHIYHLAIAGDKRNKGYGAALMRYCLEDCKKHSVYRAKLSVVHPIVARYYEQKFGFISHGGRFVQHLSLSLKPHPAGVAIVKFLRLLIKR